MKKSKITASSLLIMILSITVLLSSCGQTENFEPAEIVTEPETVTQPYIPVYSEMEVFGTKMGMTLEETRLALGLEEMVINISDSGIVSYVRNETGLDFVTEGMESSVYYLFTIPDPATADVRLCEIQYASNNDTGFAAEQAIEKFNSLYGRHSAVSEEGKTNYVWFKDGNYIIITTFTDGQNAVSYFSKAYFESTKPELARAYNEQSQEG